MDFLYRPSGVCSESIRFGLEGDKVVSVEFKGGCGGNSLGVAKLVEGMNVDEAIERLKGINCGMKETSCPDQLARAIEEAKARLESGKE